MTKQELLQQVYALYKAIENDKYKSAMDRCKCVYNALKKRKECQVKYNKIEVWVNESVCGK